MKNVAITRDQAVKAIQDAPALVRNVYWSYEKDCGCAVGTIVKACTDTDNPCKTAEDVCCTPIFEQVSDRFESTAARIRRASYLFRHSVEVIRDPDLLRVLKDATVKIIDDLCVDGVLGTIELED